MASPAKSHSRSREGIVWTTEKGYVSGIDSEGAISPGVYGVPPPSQILDAIVIGAGYAGLVAARDLATQGKKTLLIEARDRIGGRTWTGVHDGFKYEIGGTWLHWSMPHIYREISYYDMAGDMILTQIPGGKHEYHTLISNNNKRNLPLDDMDKLFGRLWSTFCNIDGVQAMETIPLPYETMRNRQAMEKWDKMSCADRLEQIRHLFSEDELCMLKAHLTQMGGGPLENQGFLDAIRWYALTGYTGTAINEVGLRTRLGSGQSALSRKIFDHAVATGNLAYAFSAPISRVEERDQLVTVTMRSGRTACARRIISTIPLNVLQNIEFVPELPSLKRQAISEGHVNHCLKVHYEVAGDDLISWNGLAYPGKGLICALADRRTRNGTHIVAFGPQPASPNGIDLQKPDAANDLKEAVNHILPIKQNIKKIIYHDWNADEFAKGTWCYWSPQYCTKYMKALQEPHGKVHFASSDWSDGYRGWIDGAVQQGAAAAKTVMKELGEAPLTGIKGNI